MIEGNGCQDNAVCGCGRSCVVLRPKACLENGASNVILREKLKANDSHKLEVGEVRTDGKGPVGRFYPVLKACPFPVNLYTFRRRVEVWGGVDACCHLVFA